MTDRISGRYLLLGLGGLVVAIAGYLGFSIGATHAGTADPIHVGPLVLPTTPVAMGLYGAGVALLVLGCLFGAVVLASRFEATDE